MSQTVKWLPKPEKHDFQAAEDYLSLIMSAKRAAEFRRKLTAARTDITHRKAKDILRASGLELLPQTNPHVAADLKKDRLSPILLVRDTTTRRLIIADGYHRVCASYWVDEDTDIPCRLV